MPSTLAARWPSWSGREWRRFAPLAPERIEAMRAEMAPRILAAGLGGCRVVQSSLGFTAASRGGAHLALSSVFADPAGVDVTSGGAR